MNIRIHAGVEKSQIKAFITSWSRCENVSVEIDPLQEDEVRSLFSVLISFLPCEFCEAVLDALIERDETPMDLLEELCRHPTQSNSCLMSICLKDGLSDELVEVCANSDDEEVKEHYLQRQTYCEKGEGVKKGFSSD